jgi:peptide/nickel transport system permease protein
MQKYILRRLALAVPTVFGVTVLIFVAMRILPGDPLQAIYGENTGIYVLSEQELANARASLGLDKPLYMQYLSWIADVARGDMGTSFWTDQSISETILRRGPITIQIAIMAIVISWLIGLPVGIIAAAWRNSLLDYGARFFVTLFMAIPSFWLGLTFILITVLFFTWKPPITVINFWDDPVRNLQMTTGPAIAMGIGLGAFIARMSRTQLLEVFREDYVRTARAKGLGEQLVMWRHVVRNALLPVVTVSGLQLAFLLGGSVAVERAFSVPGLGTALVQGIAERDWMIIQNLVLLYAIIFVLANLLVDLAYGWIDPRIRFQ